LPDTLPILRELRDDLDAAYARGGRRRPRLLPFAAAAAVAAAAVAIVALLSAPDEETTAPPSPVLAAAAATAAAQPPTAPPAGEYAYFKETGIGAARGSDEWWVARDGSGRVRETMVIPNDFEFPADDPGLPRWRRDGRQRWVRDTRFGPGEFSTIHGRVAATVLEVDVLDLPTEAEELDAELRDRLADAARDDDPETGFHGAGEPADWQLLTVIQQSLAHPLATPEQRSAFYEVAARLDAVEAVEGVEDPAGRPATMLRLDRAGERTELYFDPETSATLGWQIVYGGGLVDARVYTPPKTVSCQRCSGLG
jgi:hypothetical protein